MLCLFACDGRQLRVWRLSPSLQPIPASRSCRSNSTAVRHRSKSRICSERESSAGGFMTTSSVELVASEAQPTIWWVHIGHRSSREFQNWCAGGAAQSLQEWSRLRRPGTGLSAGIWSTWIWAAHIGNACPFLRPTLVRCGLRDAQSANILKLNRNAWVLGFGVSNHPVS